MNFVSADTLAAIYKSFIESDIAVTCQYITGRQVTRHVNWMKYDSAHRTCHFLSTLRDISCEFDKWASVIETVFQIIARWRVGKRRVQ